jgi:antirestriction protein ArdC
VTGDSHQQLLDRLIGLASEVGYQVDLCADTGRADGSCNHRTKLIQIAGRLAANGKLAVLIHELAHALVALELGDHRADTFDYASEELVVESIAFCCCQTVGLDTSANSIPYLTSWAEQASVEVLEQAAQLTGPIADRIENTLLADANRGADEAAGVESELAAAA